MKLKKSMFLQDLWASITNFDKYKKFALEPVWKTIKYIMLITFFMALIFAGAIIIKLSLEVPKATEYIEKNIPELQFQDNKLIVNQTETIELSESESYILIIDSTDTGNEKLKEYEEKVKLYSNGIILLQDKVVLKNSKTALLNVWSYNDIEETFQIQNFSKQDILNFLKSKNMINLLMITYIVIFIYLFVILLCSNLLDALILGFICIIMAILNRLKMQYRSAFGLAVHALTLPMILNLIYMVTALFTNFTIKYFDWMYKIVSYIYIITAIFIIRSDLIKQQLQLTKIMNEQEKVKMELEEKEQRDKENQEKEDVKKKDREHQKKEKGKVKDEPEGSKA